MYRIGALLRGILRVLYWRVGLEVIVWVTAFAYLAVFNPYLQTEFTICPFASLGFHHCPGCGLGRAVSFLLHGDVLSSIHTHILGVPATIILFYRILSLSNNALKQRVLQA